VDVDCGLPSGNDHLSLLVWYGIEGVEQDVRGCVSKIIDAAQHVTGLCKVVGHDVPADDLPDQAFTGARPRLRTRTAPAFFAMLTIEFSPGSRPVVLVRNVRSPKVGSISSPVSSSAISACRLPA
jgi:hypothetical protein